MVYAPFIQKCSEKLLNIFASTESGTGNGTGFVFVRKAQIKEAHFKINFVVYFMLSYLFYCARKHDY